MQVEILRVLIPFAFMGFAFASLYVHLTTRNRERLALIERGADPELFKQKEVPKSRFGNFKFGLFLIGIGIGIVAGYFLCEAGMNESAAYFSMIFLFGGIGLVVSFLMQEKLEKK